MAKNTHTSPVAVSYASALLDLAGEQKQAEQIGAELAGLRGVVDQNVTVKAFLADPSVGEAKRGEVLSKVLDGQVTPLLGNFVKLLNQKGRLGILSEISEAYGNLLDARLGKIDVDVTVAKKLSDAQLEEVRKQVSSALGKSATVNQLVDESIIGGMVLRVQDRLIDGSVKTQLAALRAQMLVAGTK